MKSPVCSDRSKLIVRGIHLWLTDAMKAAVESKAERLFRHEARILRLRIDVESGTRGHTRVFTAKGRIEIAGPDLTAAVTTEDAYNSIHLLIDKLDRLLRKRTTCALRRRSTGDIRELAPSRSPRDPRRLTKTNCGRGFMPRLIGAASLSAVPL